MYWHLHERGCLSARWKAETDPCVCVRVCVSIYTDLCGCMRASNAASLCLWVLLSSISICITSIKKVRAKFHQCCVPSHPKHVHLNISYTLHTYTTRTFTRGCRFDTRPPGAAVRQRRRSAVMTQLLGSTCHHTVWVLVSQVQSKEICIKKMNPILKCHCIGSQTAY